MIQTEILSVIFCSLILLYASHSDIKTRRVANELWILMIGVGIPLAIYNLFLYGMPFLTRFIFSLSFTWVLAYLLFRFNLFGGADAKSLIGIAVLIPTNPFNSSLIFDPFPFAITTLFNAAIVSAIVLLILLPSMFFHNLVNLDSKEFRENLSLAFIGYKIRIDALTKPKHKNLLRLLHLYEADELDGDAVKRKFILGGIDIDDEEIEGLKNYRAQGKLGEDVWVTLGLPYMLFITGGFFISLFYGNLILHIMYYLFPL